MNDLVTRISPASLPDTEALGYSQISVVEPGRLAFVSGQVATDRNGNVPTGLRAQTETVVRNLGAALEALGASSYDIVQLRIYSLDMTEAGIGTLMGVVGAFLRGARPSLTGVGVTALASPDFLLEIEMVVRVPD